MRICKNKLFIFYIQKVKLLKKYFDRFFLNIKYIFEIYIIIKNKNINIYKSYSNHF